MLISSQCWNTVINAKHSTHTSLRVNDVLAYNPTPFAWPTESCCRWGNTAGYYLVHKQAIHTLKSSMTAITASKVLADILTYKDISRIKKLIETSCCNLFASVFFLGVWLWFKHSYSSYRFVYSFDHVFPSLARCCHGNLQLLCCHI